MSLPRPRDGSRLVVVSGGGLSAASEIPAHIDTEGLWEGKRAEEMATQAAWDADREQVIRYYDTRRINCVHINPNAAHEALARLQYRWGAGRVMLATTSIDGLLVKAGAVDVLDMNGALWSIACEKDFAHPHLQIAGPQRRDRKCPVCGSFMRPDVRWVGEATRHFEKMREAVRTAETLLVVGTDLIEPVLELLETASENAVRCVEINTSKSTWPFDISVTEPAEEAVPKLVAAWLGE